MGTKIRVISRINLLLSRLINKLELKLIYSENRGSIMVHQTVSHQVQIVEIEVKTVYHADSIFVTSVIHSDYMMENGDDDYNSFILSTIEYKNGVSKIVSQGCIPSLNYLLIILKLNFNKA